MLPARALIAWALAILCGLVGAGVPSSYVVAAPPATIKSYGPDPHAALRRAVLASQLYRRDQEYKTNLTLDQSFNDLTLLSFQAGVSDDSGGQTSIHVTVVCEVCYITGLVTAELRIDGDVNITQLAEQTIDEVAGEIETIGSGFLNQTEAWAEGEIKDLVLGDWGDLELPTYNETSLELDLTPLPNTTLIFGFGGVELFLLLKTTLSQLKYQLPLIPKTPVPGFGLVVLGQDLGIYFSIDLILTAGAQIDITSGVHLRIGDGAALHVNLFGSNVSQIIFNGGDFEFLPITVHTSAGSTLNATLRVGLHAGADVHTWDPPLIGAIPHFPVFKAGIEVGLFADVAEFVFRVTETPEDPNCQIQVDQEYSFALGASAGASVTFQTYAFGPTATAATPIWSTTLASICVKDGATATTPAVTSTAALGRRQDAEMTTTTNTTIYTNVYCEASVVGVCPAALQTTTQATSTITSVLPSGETATWPTGPQSGNVITSTFGTDAHPMTSPAVVIPTVISTPIVSIVTKADTWIHQHWRQLAIGLGVGVGVPLLALILGCCIFMGRRKKRMSSENGSRKMQMSQLMNGT